MNDQQTGLLDQFATRFSAYLPTLAAGIVIIASGILVGWVAKRFIIRILVWLRLDRMGGMAGWRAAFGKGDARAALYDGIGNVTFVVTFLVFLDNALQVVGLVVLSRMIDSIVFALPNLAIVALITGVGILMANVLSGRVEDTLEEEGFKRARLAGKLVKGVLLSIVGAVALWQLDVARQIVLAAFLISFGAIGIAFALSVGLGSARAIQRAWEGMFEEKEEE